MEFVGAKLGKLQDAGLGEIAPAVDHDGRNRRRERWKGAPSDPGEGLHLAEREMVPHSRDGKTPVAHCTPAAEALYQLWGVGAPLLENEDGLMAGETSSDLDVLGIQGRERSHGISPEKGHHRAGEGPEFPLDVVAGPRAEEARLVRCEVRI